MRKLRVWSMAAILGLGLTTPYVVAAGDEEPKKPSRSWLGRLFAGPPAPIDTIEEAAEATTSAKPKEEPRDTAAEKEAEKQILLQKAQEDFNRRQSVLDRLMQLAMESGDQQLAKRLESLTDRAWNVYLKKTGKQPVTGHARGNKDNALSGRGEKP